MKTNLMAIAAVASILVLSDAALADGDSCPSKKGAHHKDMSAAMSQDGKDHHAAAAVQEIVPATESAVSSAEAKQEIPAQPAPGALKI